MKKRIVSLLLALVMAISLTLPAYAEGAPAGTGSAATYGVQTDTTPAEGEAAPAMLAMTRSTTPTTGSVAYVDEDGETKTVTATKVVDNAITAGGTWTTGWYYVEGAGTLGGMWSVRGDVNLILCDGATLTANTIAGGISLHDGTKLTIYGQSAQTGKLVACITGFGSGTLTINGGVVEATGQNGENAPSYGINVENVTVNDGKVIATGGVASGGSPAAKSYGISGNVTFNGGTLIAKAGDMGKTRAAFSTVPTLSATTYYWRNSATGNYNTNATAATTTGTYVELTTQPTGGGYISYKAWDAANKKLVDAVIAESDCTVVTNSTTNVTWSEGTETNPKWYVVEGDVTINGDVSINGNVHLILCDGATLIVNGCIDAAAQGEVSWDTLSVYGQSTGDAAGKMKVIGETAHSYSSCIWNYGINLDALYLYGGDVTACSANASAEGKNAYSRGVNAWYVAVYGGSLTATGGDATAPGDKKYAESYGIYAGDKVDVYGGTVKAYGGKAEATEEDTYYVDYVESYGIYAYNGVTIKNADVTAKGEEANGYYAKSYGIYTDNNIIFANATIVAEGKAANGASTAYSYGISAYYGYLAITNANITATGDTAKVENESEVGHEDAKSYGIFVDKDMTVNGETTIVTATGGKASSEDIAVSRGICVQNDLTIKGGTVKAIGGTATGTDGAYSYGIYVYEDLTIEGGAVEATGKDASGASYAESCGIYVADDLIIKGGTVNATSGSVTAEDVCNYGIYVDWYLKIENGKVIAKTTADSTGAIYYYCSGDYCSYKMPDRYEHNWWWRTAANGEYSAHPAFYTGNNAAALDEDYFELVTVAPETPNPPTNPDDSSDSSTSTGGGSTSGSTSRPSGGQSTTVNSAKTFDPGIAAYVVMGGISTVTSAAWLRRRKK